MAVSRCTWARITWAHHNWEKDMNESKTKHTFAAQDNTLSAIFAYGCTCGTGSVRFRSRDMVHTSASVPITLSNILRGWRYVSWTLYAASRSVDAFWAVDAPDNTCPESGFMSSTASLAFWSVDWRSAPSIPGGESWTWATTRIQKREQQLKGDLPWYSESMRYLHDQHSEEQACCCENPSSAFIWSQFTWASFQEIQDPDRLTEIFLVAFLTFPRTRRILPWRLPYVDEVCIRVNVSSEMISGPHQKHTELSPAVASLDAWLSGGSCFEFPDCLCSFIIWNSWSWHGGSVWAK
jgi:hypothetical protein